MSGAIGVTRMFLILIEAILPGIDAVHYAGRRPQHPFPPENPRKKTLHGLCLGVAFVNTVWHVGSFVVTLIHPHSDLRRVR